MRAKKTAGRLEVGIKERPEGPHTKQKTRNGLVVFFAAALFLLPPAGESGISISLSLPHAPSVGLIEFPANVCLLAWPLETGLGPHYSIRPCFYIYGNVCLSSATPDNAGRFINPGDPDAGVLRRSQRVLPGRIKRAGGRHGRIRTHVTGLEQEGKKQQD